MSTPPRIRGLVEKLERAVILQYRAKPADKTMRKQEVLTARLNVLRAFAMIAAPAQGGE